MTNKILGRDEIFAADDVHTEEVPTDEWVDGSAVIVRSLMGDELDGLELVQIAMRKLAEKAAKTGAQVTINVRAHYAALAVVDRQLNQVFTMEDVERLGRKNAAPLDRIFDAVQRLSGRSADEGKRIAKNSASTPPVASPSA